MIRGFRDSNGTVHRLDYDSLQNKPTIPVVQTATESTLGLVRPDGTTITIENGVITASGGVKVDNDTIKINSNGEIYVDIASASGVRF